MEIRTRVRRTHLILAPTGRVTAETVDEFTQGVSAVIDLGAIQLVLDLANVPYIDSMGLGAIVHLYTSTRKRGGNLKLLNVSGHNRRLLAITRLLDVFETCESEDEIDGPAPTIQGPDRRLAAVHGT